MVINNPKVKKQLKKNKNKKLKDKIKKDKAAGQTQKIKKIAGTALKYSTPVGAAIDLGIKVLKNKKRKQ